MNRRLGGVFMEKKNGFTLLELMVVIAVFSILSAIAIPNMIGWTANRRIQSAANELNAVFQLARQRALRENADVVVLIDLANDSCEVFVDNGQGGGVANNQTRDGGETRLDLVRMPAGVDMYNSTFAQPWCGYTSRGIPINNNTGQLYMQNTAGRYMGIWLNIAGNPRIIESDDAGATWH